MRTRCSRWVAAAALAAAFAAFLPAGCDSPGDDTLLRFLGFQSAGSSGTDSSVSMIEGALRDGAALKVDASFENQTLALDSSGAGPMGITIYRVEVDYSMAGYDPPSFSYPVSLYAPPATAKDATGGGTVVLSDIPIVPVSVKQWLIDNTPSETDGVVEMTAKVNFLAHTDAGEDLTVGGSLAVSLTDGDGGTTESEVSIQATIQDASSDTDGKFTVYRRGGTAALTIYYAVNEATDQAVAGDSCGTGVDYVKLPGNISLAASQNEKSFEVQVCTQASGLPKPVEVTLTDDPGYTAVEPRSAKVTIREN